MLIFNPVDPMTKWKVVIPSCTGVSKGMFVGIFSRQMFDALAHLTWLFMMSFVLMSQLGMSHQATGSRRMLFEWPDFREPQKNKYNCGDHAEESKCDKPADNSGPTLLLSISLKPRISGLNFSISRVYRISDCF